MDCLFCLECRIVGRAAAAARVLVFGVLEGICRKQIERDRRVQVADLSDLAFAEPMRDAGVVSVGQRL